MPFEPRLIGSYDGPDDELQLPADLAALAEQLSAEADRLEECYPVQTPTAATPPAWRLWRAASARIAAAVVLLAAGLWTASGFIGNSPRLDSHGGSVNRLARGEHASSGSRSAAVVSVSLASFHELTSPEQEGLLDLLEDQALAQSSLSF